MWFKYGLKAQKLQKLLPFQGVWSETWVRKLRFECPNTLHSSLFYRNVLLY